MQQGVFIEVISVFGECCEAVQATLLNCICLKLKISGSKCQAQAIRMFLVAAYLLNHFADRSIKDPQGISFSCQARTQVGLVKHGRCLGSESPFVCGNSPL